eukprot:431468_1
MIMTEPPENNTVSYTQYDSNFHSQRNSGINDYMRCRGYKSHTTHHSHDNNEKDIINNVSQQIIDQLSCPAKSVYNARDIVWVQINNEPIIAVIKFVLNDEYIIRPLGKSEMNEIKIMSNQILNKPHAQMHPSEIKQIIRNIQYENQRYINGHMIELYDNTLIKYKNDIFGTIISKNDNGTYNIKIKQGCKWYNGPQIITQISRHNIDPAHEYEFKWCVAKFENTFNSDDTNIMDVFYFLDEIGNYYINEFIKNGFTSITFLLLITEQDLISMGIKLAHIRYILHKIQSYNKDEFDIIRQEKQKQRKKLNANIEDRLPGDVIQYILSFNNDASNIRIVCKKFKEYSDQNKLKQLSKRAEVVEEEMFPNDKLNINNTWIIHPTRKQLTDEEIKSEYLGPIDSIYGAMAICESGDRLLIHDGDYCLFVDVYNYRNTDKSIQFIGIGDNVRVWLDQYFVITGNCSVYFKNIKIAFEKNSYQPTILLTSNANLFMKDCNLFGDLDRDQDIVIYVKGNGEVNIRNCKFTTGYWPISIDGQSERNINIIGCMFTNCGDRVQQHGCIQLEISASFKSLKCVGNIFFNN